MGREIVYCEGCGRRLTEDEFARGRARTIDNCHYCVECRPLEAPPPPPIPPPPQPSRPATTKIPVPPSTRRQRVPAPAAARSRTPLIVGGVVGGFVLIVLTAVVLSSGQGKAGPAPQPPRIPGPDPAPPPPPPPPPPPAEDRALPALKKLLDFAASSTDPDAILLRCDEARPLLKGGPHEAKFREIEERALEARKLRTDASRLDNFLAQIRDLRAQDRAFLRRDEILNMLRSAAGMAGPRRAEVEQIIVDYGRAFEEAAESQAAAARAEALKLAEEKDFAEALKRIDEVPSPFRATKPVESLAALRGELAKKAQEWEADQRLWPWNLWRITSGKERDAPCRLASHEGRTNVYLTHPVSQEAPATLEREFEIPAGRKAALSFWVTHHGLGDWELRVFADGQMLHRQDVGPNWSGWRRVQLDLSPLAGRKFTLRLENKATAWIWEFGYWSDIEVTVESSPIAPSPDGSFLLDGSTAVVRGRTLRLKTKEGHTYLGSWTGEDETAEWTPDLPWPGTYSVELTYACNAGNGGDFVVSAGEARLAGRSEPTGGWTQFKAVTLGKVSLPAGRSQVTVKGTRFTSGLMNLKSLRLVPSP